MDRIECDQCREIIPPGRQSCIEALRQGTCPGSRFSYQRVTMVLCVICLESIQRLNWRYAVENETEFAWRKRLACSRVY
jgi:hypothetical protein